MKVPKGITVFGKKKYSAGEELPAELNHLLEKKSKIQAIEKEKDVAANSNRTRPKDES